MTSGLYLCKQTLCESQSLCELLPANRRSAPRELTVVSQFSRARLSVNITVDIFQPRAPRFSFRKLENIESITTSLKANYFMGETTKHDLSSYHKQVVHETPEKLNTINPTVWRSC